MKILKKTLMTRVQEDNPGVSMKTIGEIQDSLFKNIMEAVADGDSVLIYGFGKFEAHRVDTQVYWNYLAKKDVEIPAHYRPSFKPSLPFIQVVKGDLSD